MLHRICLICFVSTIFILTTLFSSQTYKASITAGKHLIIKSKKNLRYESKIKIKEYKL